MRARASHAGVLNTLSNVLDGRIIEIERAKDSLAAHMDALTAV